MNKHLKTLAFAMLCVAMALCVSCKKNNTDSSNDNPSQAVATVITDDVTDITKTTAVCGGEVTSENNWAVTERGVCWSMAEHPTLSDFYTVDGDGIGKFKSTMAGLQPGTTYYVRAYAKNAAGIGFGSEKSFTTLPDDGSGAHDFVDLGLPSGTLWATCNVGAENPEDYGDYFAWGEKATKSLYDWSTYQWCNGSYNNLTKYNISSDYGTVDDKTVLESEDDVANVNWDGDWRMPTTDEWQELYDNTIGTWTTQNDVSGWCFTSTVSGHTDVSLFLPAAGGRFGTMFLGVGSEGRYWSSSVNISSPNSAYEMCFHSDNANPQHFNNRSNGFTVRPVR